MKIKTDKSFFALIVLSIILGEFPKFALFWLAVLLHELSHIIIAKFLGFNTRLLSIQALGMSCIIDGMEQASLYKKIIITITGIVSNIFVFLLFNILKIDSVFVTYFMQCNLILAIFNLLPIYPLDGSKLFLYSFGYFFGHLNSTKKLIKIGKFLSVCIASIGFLLTILSFSNIIFYIMGIYLFKKQNSELYAKIYYDFHKFLDSKYDSMRRYRLKQFVFSKESTLNDVLNILSYDHQIICYYYDKDIYVDIFERDLFNLLKTNPLSTRLSSINPLTI